MSAWGLVDLLVQQNVTLHREATSGFTNPGILTISIDGAGALSTYHGTCFLGGIRGPQLVLTETKALQSEMLIDRMAPTLTPFAAAIARVLGDSDVDFHFWTILREWENTVARLCIGLRRLGTGGSLLITPAPLVSMLTMNYKCNYRRLGESVVLRCLDKQYSQECWAQVSTSKASGRVPSDLVGEMQLAEADAGDREDEVTGAVKVVTALASADGVVLLDPALRVRGFGVKIDAGQRVKTVYDGPAFSRRGAQAKRVDTAHVGTRHGSMLRYCRADRMAAGIVVSQDGHVRLIMSSGRSLTLWDNVQLRRRHTASLDAIRKQRVATAAQRRDEQRQLGYTSTPKTIAALLSSP
jgi:hypothetical protein